MTILLALIKRNVKLYFKDKGMFFCSLITPIILLVLYVTFLKNVYELSFLSSFAELGVTLPEKLVGGIVGGELISSLLAVSCVTVAFCSNLIMVQDKTNGARDDLTIAPIRSSTLALSYFFATLISTAIICYIATAIGFVYLAVIGWYLSFADVLLLLLDVFLLVLFGTALSSLVIFPLSTNGQASAVGTIVSSGYGFICGAYMPISSFSKGLQRVISFLPGTYGTSLVRNHALNGAISALNGHGVPIGALEALRDSVDCNLYFFGNQVPLGVTYAIIVGAILLLVGAYVAINALIRKKKSRFI